VIAKVTLHHRDVGEYHPAEHSSRLQPETNTSTLLTHSMAFEEFIHSSDMS
jgi:hypothetical protein